MSLTLGKCFPLKMTPLIKHKLNNIKTFLPVCNFPSNQAGPFGTTDFICKNSSLESSPPIIVKPKPRIDFTRVERILSPTSLWGFFVKTLLLLLESKGHHQ